MATNRFGKTWWGSEWLKSLTHIDYDKENDPDWSLN